MVLLREISFIYQAEFTAIPFCLQAIVCNSSDPDSRCFKNCDLSFPRHRQRRSLSYNEPLHAELLSHGPILLRNAEKLQEGTLSFHFRNSVPRLVLFGFSQMKPFRQYS